MSTKKRTSVVTLLATLAISAVSFGALTYYVVNRPPADPIRTETSVSSNARQSRTDVPARRESVETHSPSYAGGQFSTRTEPTRVPAGQDPMVFAINNYLDKLKNVPKEVDVTNITVKNQIASVNFNDKMNGVSFGSEDEQIFVEGMVKVLSQFPEINSVIFTVDGRRIETFGHFEVLDPVPIQRASNR
ncbi:MAG: GerMN domain-containing protein [Fimbriimonadaceae bacterium]|nr:GerMN domain-containing protein [Fimbriimonadaceae bacterium]